MQNPTTGLSDISNLPAEHRVKPMEGKIEQSASQSSTMQSVSMNEVNNENVREQMPEGSLEHLNAEPSLISQGVEAVREFAHKAVEKIEEFVNATAEKIHDITKPSLTNELSKDASELKQSVTKRAYLVRKSLSGRLGKRTEKLEKKAGLAAGIGKVYAKEELKSLRRKANRYGRNFNRDTEQTKRTLKSEGKRMTSELSKGTTEFGAQLREGASQLRRQARKFYNELPRTTMSQGKPTTGDFTEAPSKFLLEFSSNDMNGRTLKSRTETTKRSGFESDFQGKPSQFTLEVSAHDWNESVSTPNKYAGQLMDLARSYMKRASKQSHYAERRFRQERRSLKKKADELIEKKL